MGKKPNFGAFLMFFVHILKTTLMISMKFCIVVRTPGKLKNYDSIWNFKIPPGKPRRPGIRLKKVEKTPRI